MGLTLQRITQLQLSPSMAPVASAPTTPRRKVAKDAPASSGRLYGGSFAAIYIPADPGEAVLVTLLSQSLGNDGGGSGSW